MSCVPSKRAFHRNPIPSHTRVTITVHVFSRLSHYCFDGSYRSPPTADNNRSDTVRFPRLESTIITKNQKITGSMTVYCGIGIVNNADHDNSNKKYNIFYRLRSADRGVRRNKSF